MMDLLVNKWIPDHENTEDAGVRMRYGILSGAVGIACNTILFLGKLIAGLLSGSIAIMADAFNNLSDVGSSVVTLIGFKLSGQKADADHPFGHGRIEYVAGLIVSVLIILVGFELARDSFVKILHPETTQFSLVILMILFVSILIKGYMYLYNQSFAKKLSSVALASTAKDSRNDMISTGAVLLSQMIGTMTGLRLDGWCGIAVAAFILVSGISSLKDTANPLLGEEPDPELVDKIEHTVMSYHNILGMHDLIIHDYGPGRRMMSLHAEVPADMTLVEAHALADRIELRLLKEYGISTVIHVDPHEVNDPATRLVQEKVGEYLSELSPDILFHDLRIVTERNHLKVMFDVNVPFGFALSDEEIVDNLKERLQQLDVSCRPLIHVDHYNKT